MQLVAEIDGIEYLREHRPAEVVRAQVKAEYWRDARVLTEAPPRHQRGTDARNHRMAHVRGTGVLHQELGRTRESFLADAVHGGRFLDQRGRGGVSGGVVQ